MDSFNSLKTSNLIIPFSDVVFFMYIQLVVELLHYKTIKIYMTYAFLVIQKKVKKASVGSHFE